MLHKFKIFLNRQVNNVSEAEVNQKAINATNTQKCTKMYILLNSI